MKKSWDIVINSAWCKGCAICVDFCPKNVLTIKSGKVIVENIENCTGCKLCELRCPDYVIRVEGGDEIAG